ncbi:MAG: peptidylprolyl isomerase [Gemmatimonadota bacterium]|nr:peptidylprolyl isomerase [Gemmatimonadota bacterium]
MPTRCRWILSATIAISPCLAAAQGTGSRALRVPDARELAKAGPDSFDVAFHTTKGVFAARIRRAGAPRGADRVWHAVQARYYDGVRFYRVIPGFMAQFGFHGDPTVNRAWEAHPMRDDPVRGSNTRGMLTFANRGPNTRTVQLFVNTGNNLNLDALGFAPVGQVLEGMAVVDSLYSGYGEGAPRGRGPDQDRIAARGNAYLTREFPKLDAIDSARVVRKWP